MNYGLLFNPFLIEVWRELEIQNLKAITRVVSRETLAQMPVLNLSYPIERNPQARRIGSHRDPAGKVSNNG